MGYLQAFNGTVIWTLPDGHTYVTTPGSALLFPSLCRGTGAPPAPETGVHQDYCGERTAMMPKRTRTRAQNRAARIATERRQNRQARPAKGREREAAYFGPTPSADGDDDPPPC
ncbi:hypothetical protein [Mycobacterium sp.]|uniref:hypothetical protein n=1 Tax=Mycobacterium sp. TaxID=1785 RepID=UPI003F7E613C